MDLETATTDDLIDELAKRFTHLIVAGVKDTKNDPECEDFYFRYTGGLTASLGTAARCKVILEHDALHSGEEE